MENAMNYISSDDCIYLESEYDARINAFIENNMGWIQNECRQVNRSFYYVPFSYPKDVEVIRYNAPYLNPKEAKVVPSSMQLFQFLNVAPDGFNGSALLFGKRDEYAGYVINLWFCPLQPGTDEQLKTQFHKWICETEPERRKNDRDCSIMFSIVSEPNEEWGLSSNKSSDEREIEAILREISDRVDMLRIRGVDELLIQKAFQKEYKLSSLHVTKDYQIVLPEYGMNIEMKPLTKAVYFLYLRHPEGIRFKLLRDNRDELLDIYAHLTNRTNTMLMEKAVDGVVDTLRNDFNIHRTRIKTDFCKHFDEKLAQNYILTGYRGGEMKISLPRNLVFWESGNFGS